MTIPSKWWWIVYTLWNQLLLEFSLDFFNILQICYRYIEDVHEEVKFDAEKKFFNKLTVFLT